MFQSVNNKTTYSYTILFLVKTVTISFCLQSCNAEEFGYNTINLYLLYNVL